MQKHSRETPQYIAIRYILSDKTILYGLFTKADQTLAVEGLMFDNNLKAKPSFLIKNESDLSRFHELSVCGLDDLLEAYEELLAL